MRARGRVQTVKRGQCCATQEAKSVREAHFTEMEPNRFDQRHFCGLLVTEFRAHQAYRPILAKGTMT